MVFPKTYKEAEGYLYGEVDPETGAQLSDAFVRIKGKLERSDRGDQIIAQEIVPLELNEENNKPKVFEVMVPNSRFSQGNMARLATVLAANPGGDRVEIFIEQVDGRVLRAEVPAKVNARSINRFYSCASYKRTAVHTGRPFRSLQSYLNLISFPSSLHCLNSAEADNRRSEEEFRAVSTES